jgi:diacylglycerol kinase (ATP)
MKRIYVVINPASGNDEPILNTLNKVFAQYGVKWDVGITHEPGDARRLARKAAESGYELVAGYGGDGTQMEVINGLHGTGVTFGLLPGGTGNAMAFELGVPRSLDAAAELLCKSETTRSVDVGQACGQNFLLRAYTGPKPEHVATREEKDTLGILAYPLASIRVLANLVESSFRITIDGKSIEDSGLACFVFNAGSSGGIPANIPSVSVSDGLLDIFLLSGHAHSPLALASFLLAPKKTSAHLHYWKGRDILVEPEQKQTIWLDGEAAGETPGHFKILPAAISVLVPESD